MTAGGTGSGNCETRLHNRPGPLASGDENPHLNVDRNRDDQLGVGTGCWQPEAVVVTAWGRVGVLARWFGLGRRKSSGKTSKEGTGADAPTKNGAPASAGIDARGSGRGSQ